MSENNNINKDNDKILKKIHIFYVFAIKFKTVHMIYLNFNIYNKIT